MASFLEAQLKQYGVETEAVELGNHVMEGQNLEASPCRLGEDWRRQIKENDSYLRPL